MNNAERSSRAWEEFQARLAAMGATFADTEWRGTQRPHRVICSQGHECTPIPRNVQQGRGICRVCARISASDRARLAFLAHLEAIGATFADTEWRGTAQKHRVICSQGHECWPKPNSVQQGHDVCWTCGQGVEVARLAFLAHLDAIGATFADTEWRGTQKPHRVICNQGHECFPRSNQVLNCGKGICRVCAGNDSEVAYRAFLAHLDAIGATFADTEWRGTQKPHRVICNQGHECFPRPGNVVQGQGACRVCSGRDSETARLKFVANLADFGAILHDTRWRGVHVKYHVTCAAGHECWPTPHQVQQGGGICIQCHGFVAFDRVYLVQHGEWAKVGIAFGSRRVRLHLSRGYVLVFESESLSPGVPRMIEQAVLGMLREEGVPQAPYGVVPEDGITETFPAEHLDRVRTVVRSLVGDWAADDPEDHRRS